MHAKNIVFDFDKINSLEEFYAVTRKKLQLPDYFGNNLDALYDCLTGYIGLPVKITFTHLSKEQLTAFDGIIKTFEDAHAAMGKDIVFHLR